MFFYAQLVSYVLCACLVAHHPFTNEFTIHAGELVMDGQLMKESMQSHGAKQENREMLEREETERRRKGGVRKTKSA